MKWVDYREKLGIGVNDEQKFSMFKNKIHILFELLEHTRQVLGYEILFLTYFSEIGERATYPYSYDMAGVCNNIVSTRNMNEAIAKATVFSNCLEKFGPAPHKNLFKKGLDDSLSDLKISVDIFKDADGEFLFPKGAKELDDALVSEPLEWLKDYPNAHKTFVIALKQYSEGVYIRDVADNLRKALESFLQEFLGNAQNLESNKIEICKHLGSKGVDPGICGLFQPLINSYKNINDRIVKHNDAVDKKLLEFLLYQTGVLIRMVLSVEGVD